MILPVRISMYLYVFQNNMNLKGLYYYNLFISLSASLYEYRDSLKLMALKVLAIVFY